MMHDIASGMKYLTDKGYIHTVNTTPVVFSVALIVISRCFSISRKPNPPDILFYDVSLVTEAGDVASGLACIP